MPNPYLALLTVSWRYAKKEKLRYLMIYVFFIICSTGLAVTPLLYGWLVDSLQENGTAVIESLWKYVVIYLGLQIAVSAINGPTRIMERQLAFNISRNFLDDLFHKLLSLPVNWHQEHHSGSTVNRLKKAYGSLKSFFQNGFFYFYTFAQFVFSLVGMLYFSVLWGSVALLLGIVTIWVILQFDKPFIKTLVEVNEKEHLVSATLSDSLVNIFTVITLRLEGRMKLDLMGKFKNMLPPFRRNIIINEWKWFFANLLICLIYIVMVAGYIYGEYKPGEVFMLGGLVALLGFVNQFTNAFSRIAQSYTEIVALNTDVQTVQSIEDAYASKVGLENMNSLISDWKKIEINNLSFQYKNQSEHRGLQQLALSFSRGERIAIIGESGSGKSTLFMLLRGLYDAAPEFELKVDGKLKSSLGVISESVTLFPQEPEIFENTVLYNITLGLPFSDEEVRDVCDIVCLTEVIESLPNGLESTLVEKGVNLSVGQKQRLAMARGILASRNSTIILLDEPTSSVDSYTEAIIYKKLFNAFAGKVVISSLHRLQLLPLFDYAYVIDNGKIVERGTQEELMNGSYLKMSSEALSS